MQKIGVFVCWCGSNIAATVDVAAVVEALKVQPGVVYATDYQYMCSASGQNIIKDAIKEYGLTGVVICSCSPRMHEATFRKTVQAAGLNPYMLEIANIREQCSCCLLYTSNLCTWYSRNWCGKCKGACACFPPRS